MNGRTTVVILFFWAILTIVTPILVRLSASATKPTMFFEGEKIEGTKAGLKTWLPRRALVARAPPQAQPLPLSLAPAQAPKISPQSGIKSLSKGDNQSFHSS
ncbi:hypothetical protein Vadar_021383 [Vaccinium darrowii]|uniref:Uncharacterized protein n=1 Tax=Vaccinium darrowii TaxID=229202 RepID=A0ACB7Y834_9ERIC|nr:hypothetical protein Vadar_021383 [Vaccinium darrowii]